ncbi:tRNA lysidine(34) synthetase TilS [Flagellimonas allohymeniacidonis]|uniref:tRNA(Ile)-lysidine synthase n=1 Tax=Flagellimonas allohymeniacidonis TaxID=2517819 RepID=A0A4Q8QL45_9FLAO|nr:tRNA lysidine(34) synthetase TilS [Allomuricauda hymeniacidonis]TAI48966.1 tRNA lysidine(34) synthetase TilS [Allomuricauda hymeniacidonis]
MLQEFQQNIENQLSFLKKSSLVVACSGGVDSVVLAHICHQLGLDIVLAHCNFKLRGLESDGDEKFVKQLGKALGLTVFTTSFDTLAHVKTHGGSVQMAARELRYQWFDELLEMENKDYVLTAHQADDCLETFLINLSRGTGIEGLTGIPEVNNRVVRPLLQFSREEILAYAQSANLKWREDSSNRETKYLRNKIRKEITPKLKELHPTFLDNFLRTREYLLQTKGLVDKTVENTRTNLFVKEGQRTKIPIKELKKLEPLKPYLFGLFHPYGFTEWDDVHALLSAMSGKEVHSKTHRLLKDRAYLILKEITVQESSVHLLEEEQKTIKHPIHLTIEEVSQIENPSKNTVFLDKEKLNYPLVLRKWEKGDYFYPLGMQGKKKLSKFFKDEKMDVFSKEKQWLICSGDEVAWVVGRRGDERFKVSNASQKIIKITVNE